MGHSQALGALNGVAMFNPITSLPAFEFLMAYGIFCAVILCACYGYSRFGGREESALTEYPDPPAEASEVDPYEIAYMRGGEQELIRAVATRLTERGVVQVREGRIEAVVAQGQALTPLELTVHDAFAEGQTAEDVFQSDLPARVLSHCLPYDERLQRHRFVHDEARLAREQWVKRGGFALIAGVALLRAVVGVSRGRPIGFLLLMAAVALVCLAVVCMPRRLTPRGRVYLARLRRSFEDSRGLLGENYTLSMAIAGVAALNGTAYQELGRTFDRARRVSDVAGGVGCGAGYGGGCGGCGG